MKTRIQPTFHLGNGLLNCFKFTLAACAVLVACQGVTAQDAFFESANDPGSEHPPEPFQLFNRWSSTATNGGGLGQGDPTTLRWSIVPDGTTINAAYPNSPQNEVTSGSNLRASFDTLYGAGPGGTDLTQRPWYSVFSASYARLAQVSGLSFTYEVNDDGNAGGAIGASSNGVIGTRGDIRIGGHTIDGQSGSNILAYNYYPDGGEMVIDTSNTSFYGSGNATAVRNAVMHEAGHGVGLAHVDPSNGTKLMEPFISAAYQGPQIDDILGLQRNYGDAREKSGGNDTALTATNLGAVGYGGSAVIGADGSKTTVAFTDVDFVSIDGTSDNDFFKFTLPGTGLLTSTMTPVGITYNVGPADSTSNNEASFNASAQNNLGLQILGTNGITVLVSSNVNGLGGAESIANLLLAAGGTYYARVFGTTDTVQLYRLNIAFAAVAEPATFVPALLAFGALFTARRRKRS